MEDAQAVIHAVPADNARTRPFALTLTTLGADDDQRTGGKSVGLSYLYAIMPSTALSPTASSVMLVVISRRVNPSGSTVESRQENKRITAGSNQRVIRCFICLFCQNSRRLSRSRQEFWGVRAVAERRLHLMILRTGKIVMRIMMTGWRTSIGVTTSRQFGTSSGTSENSIEKAPQ
jgi:hypothetical protein